ncbi:hypothetical protein CR513_09404, partial [Mucuna pruriens]
MQGSNKSVIRLKSGGPPLEVKTWQKATSSKTGAFSAERYITYSVGKRLLSLNIAQMGCAGRVNIVTLDLSEQSCKGGAANLNLRFIQNDRYGVLCNTKSKFEGSFDSFKENYCVPPLPDAELVCYFCRETGCGGCFTLEKKKGNDDDVVERVKVTHAFVVDDELNVSVQVKIVSERGGGLRVEVEGPMKLTMDYTKQTVSRIRGKMESEIEANAIALFTNAIRQLPNSGSDGGY